MPSQSSEYFAARALAERLMSEFTTDPRAVSVHAEMAVRYEELADEFAAPDEFQKPVEGVANADTAQRDRPA